MYTFWNHPDILMIHVSDSRPVILPPMTAPFETEEVAEAINRAHTPARVTKMAPRRWTRAILQAKNNERADRINRQSSAIKATATILLGSNEPTSADRAGLALRSQRLQDELRTLRSTIDRAKSDAHASGKFMPVSEFRGLEDRRRAISAEYDAVCRQLGQLRRSESGATAAKFQAAAHKILDADTLQSIYDAIAEDGGGNEAPEPQET